MPKQCYLSRQYDSLVIENVQEEDKGMQGPVIAVRPLMQKFCKNFKLIIVNLINMLQLVDFFFIFSILSSNATAVESPASTTSARRPVFQIPKVPITNSYILNLLKAPASTLEPEVSNIVVAY